MRNYVAVQMNVFFYQRRFLNLNLFLKIDQWARRHKKPYIEDFAGAKKRSIKSMGLFYFSFFVQSEIPSLVLLNYSVI